MSPALRQPLDVAGQVGRVLLGSLLLALALWEPHRRCAMSERLPPRRLGG
jgi:hypothetical protein